MRLQVLLPTKVLVDEPCRKVSAEGSAGEFTLLPNHVDCVATLEPGLLSFEDGNGEEVFLAVDTGTLVKCGDDVKVSTPRAERGRLGELRRKVAESYEQLSKRERQARSALERIEADFIRRFIELEHRE